jgi:hypothetical protein
MRRALGWTKSNELARVARSDGKPSTVPPVIDAIETAMLTLGSDKPRGNTSSQEDVRSWQPPDEEDGNAAKTDREGHCGKSLRKKRHNRCGAGYPLSQFCTAVQFPFCAAPDNYAV